MERIYKGVGLSPGRVEGRAALAVHLPVAGRSESKEVRFAEEIKRFFEALNSAKKDLELLQTKVVKTYKKQEAADIVTTYLMFIDDPTFVEEVINSIKNGKSAYEAVMDFFTKIIERLKSVDDKYLRERVKDIKYVRRFIINKLFETEINWGEIAQKGDILVIPFLSPVDVIQLKEKGFKGAVVERGGETSHTAILSRALSFPIVKLPDATEILEDGLNILVDGDAGEVIVNPKKERLSVSEREKKPVGEPKTKDGVYIEIYANIDFPEEASTIRFYGARGVGIFRTEYLYMTSRDWPDEEYQKKYIERFLEFVGDLPATVRIADLGGDKIPIYADFLREIINYRGIRFFMLKEKLFRTHIRAILRAFSNRELRLLVPMVSDPYEIRWVKRIIQDELKELSEKPEKIYLGAMVETPASVYRIREISEEADFISVGTNDLVSLTFGIERELDLPEYLEPPANNSLIVMLSKIIKESTKEVTICGELARNEKYLPYILRSGIRKLSVNPAFIPELIEKINKLSLKEN